MKAFIKAIHYYLPKEILDNDTLSRLYPEWSIEKIAAKTGIMSRHIAAENEFVSDMAIKAAICLFDSENISPKDIDFIILCTQSPDYPLPTTACIIQDQLGIPTTAGAMDFNLGCSGYVYGLAIAKGLVFAKIASNILLLTSETYTKYIHAKDKSNRTIFGDGASATLIGKQGIAEIGEFELGTDGKGVENLIVKQGGRRNPELTFEEYTDNYGNIRNSSCLYMNGPEIFTFTLKEVPKLIENTLLKNRLTMEDVNLFIFHQANLFMLKHLKKKIHIPDDKFYYFIENCGNTVSSTIPIALKEALKGEKIYHGNNILLAGFGVGYSWGGVVLKF